MKILITVVVLFATGVTIPGLAQDSTDLLSLVEGDVTPKKEYINAAFKSPRVINSHSISFLAPGTMDFRILHRFGSIDQGFKTLFGLDQASMRLGFDFGLTRNLMVGIGRSTYKKEMDGFIKYAPIVQSTGQGQMPFTLALVAGMTMHTMELPDTIVKNPFTSRLGYYFQAIIGRKFNESISLQLIPTLIHKNLVALASQSNDIFAIGAGGRVKVSKRVALTCDYSYRINVPEDDIFHNPLSVGVDIETGGHVFQLHISNAVGMNEVALITETIGTWGNGEIRFGFNLSRVFQLKKKKTE